MITTQRRTESSTGPSSPATTLGIDARALLDAPMRTMISGDAAAGARELMAGLAPVKAALSAEEWRSFIDEQCRTHPIKDIVHLDPICSRSSEQPRGYAGDAVLIDYIYGQGTPPSFPEKNRALARELYDAFRHAPPCRAVRARRRLVSECLDEVAARTPGPRVLSVAAGHGREAGGSRAFREGQIREYVALDQDAESLAVVEREYSRLHATPVHANVRDLIAGRLSLGEFDFAYSMGLFDYLSQRAARTLVRRMFDMLRPGGRLLVGNFLSDLPSPAFMEAYMDWHLIYRSAAEIEDLAASVPSDRIAGRQAFNEKNDNIRFLELVKR